MSDTQGTNAMTDLKTVHSDIAFMKALASDGGEVPAIAGAHLLAAGLIYGLSTLMAGAILTGWLDLPRAWASWAGGAPTLVYLPVMAVLIWLGRHVKGGSAAKAMAAAWGGIGLVTVTILLSLVAVSWRLHDPRFLVHAWPPVALSLYAGAWLVFAIVRGRPKWALITAGCIVSALAAALATDSQVEWVVMGVSLLAWMAAPGAVLMWLGRARG